MRLKKGIIFCICCLLALLAVGVSYVMSMVEWKSKPFSYERRLNDEADKFIDRYRVVKQIEPIFASFDVWGTQMKVWKKDSKIFVQSAGPDKVFDTADDHNFSKVMPSDLL